MLELRTTQDRFVAALACAMALFTGSAMAQTAEPGEDPPTSTVTPVKEFWLGTWGYNTTTWQDCSATKPFLTLDQARAQVRAYKAAQPSNNPLSIIVHVAGGLYPMTVPVLFESEDSGWPGFPIVYAAWNPGGIGGVNSDDALFSGGVRLTGWTPRVAPSGVTAYVAPVPANITDIRDVWVNNQRMVRARFPNVPTCSGAYSDPITPPCSNQGYLVVTHVEATTRSLPPPDGQQPFQGVTVRSIDPDHPNDANYPGPPIPVPTDWSHVEASATRYWVNPQARVQFGDAIVGQPWKIRLEFRVHSFGTGIAEQDLGALGCFYYENWDPNQWRPDEQCKRPYLQIVGELDVTTPLPNLPHRNTPAQLFLSNDLAFLDADKEWYFDAQNHELWLKLCANPDQSGTTVTVPVAQKLLFLDRAQNLTFDGLSWAFTHQPFPLMVDGVSPGYSSIQAGQVWLDSSWPYWNNIVDAAITMIGTQSCTLSRCRIAHTGGSGVIIGTAQGFTLPSNYTESNYCRLSICEVFDIGAHGVYVGDERGVDDHTWAAPSQSSSAPDPSNGITIEYSKIQNYGVVYRDSVGIYAGHTRDLAIRDNEISYGNYDGISIGTHQAHHLNLTIPASICGENILYTNAQNGEGTTIARNNIHHVMLKLTDGGGIYMSGSHLTSSVTGAPSQLLSNYVHDIVLNPFINITYSDTQCRGLYWESGSDGWLVQSNYTEHCQAPYHFNVGTDANNQCAHVPSIWGCNGTSSPTSPPVHQWWAPAWPTTWLLCSTQTILVPGQTWGIGVTSNIWLDPFLLTGPYDTYAHCVGYGYPTSLDLAQFGGMWALTWPYSASNFLVISQDDPVQGQRIKDIITSAGPDDDILGWFSPTPPRQVHRTPICGGAVDPTSQIQ